MRSGIEMQLDVRFACCKPHQHAHGAVIGNLLDALLAGGNELARISQERDSRRSDGGGYKERTVVIHGLNELRTGGNYQADFREVVVNVSVARDSERLRRKCDRV